MFGRTASLLAVAALTLSLASCGSDLSARDSVTNTRMAVKKYTTAVDNGTYRAGSDGSVAPGSSKSARDMERLEQDVKRGTEDVLRNAKNAMDDMGRGVSRAAGDLAGR